jgi:3-oxoacyl-[acyl-carrier protein] reductase
MSRVMVVSGGGTGIGKATARALAGDGAHVVILGRRLESLEAAAAEIEDAVGPGSVSCVRADLRQPDDVQAVADHVARVHGVVDAIINNAGGGDGAIPGEGLAGVADAWRRSYEQNVISAALLTSALLPMLRRRGGSIVLVGSMASRSGGGGGPYGAAKGALDAWVLALSAELGPEGITANVVSPGYTPDTELFGPGLPAELHEKAVARTALGRAGRATDVAGVIRFLVSPDASFVTGQVIEVDGGVLAPLA